MKPNLLIVSQDIAKIQTFSGKLGKHYSRLYSLFLSFKIYLIVSLCRFKYKITLLSTQEYKLFLKKNLIYHQVLDREQSIKFKPLAWQLFEEINQQIHRINPQFTQSHSISLLKVWENKISVQLMYDYLFYYELLTRIINKKSFDSVMVLGQSQQENMAIFIARQKLLHTLKIIYPNFDQINNYLIQFFRNREMKKKINNLFKQSNHKQKQATKNTVLISLDFFRYLKTLAPIYLSLKKAKLSPVFISDIQEVQTYLKNFNLNDARLSSIASFISKRYLSKINQWYKITKQINNQFEKSINLLPNQEKKLLIKQYLFELKPIISHGLILSKLYIHAANKLINKLKPRAVLVAGDIRLIENSLSLVAKNHQIKSFTVSPRTMIFDEETYKYDLTDKYLVTGKFMADKLIKIGVKPAAINIIGDPRYDHFINLKKIFDKSLIYQKLNINDLTKKIILLISFRPNPQLTVEEKKDFFLFASQAAQKIPGTVLIAKPHPTEKRYRLLEQLKQWGITNIIVSDNQTIELSEILLASSVVALTWSMTGLEAMILDRPVIVINPHSKDYNKFIPYIKKKSAVEARSVKKLTTILKTYINPNNPQTRKLLKTAKLFSKNYIETPNGKVGEGIARFITNST